MCRVRGAAAVQGGAAAGRMGRLRGKERSEWGKISEAAAVAAGYSTCLAIVDCVHPAALFVWFAAEQNLQMVPKLKVRQSTKNVIF